MYFHLFYYLNSIDFLALNFSALYLCIIITAPSCIDGPVIDIFFQDDIYNTCNSIRTILCGSAISQYFYSVNGCFRKSIHIHT